MSREEEEEIVTGPTIAVFLEKPAVFSIISRSTSSLCLAHSVRVPRLERRYGVKKLYGRGTSKIIKAACVVHAALKPQNPVANLSSPGKETTWAFVKLQRPKLKTRNSQSY